jgi:hypothetical protein
MCSTPAPIMTSAAPEAIMLAAAPGGVLTMSGDATSRELASQPRQTWWLPRSLRRGLRRSRRGLRWWPGSRAIRWSPRCHRVKPKALWMRAPIECRSSTRPHGSGSFSQGATRLIPASAAPARPFPKDREPPGSGVAPLVGASAGQPQLQRSDKPDGATSSLASSSGCLLGAAGVIALPMERKPALTRPRVAANARRLSYLANSPIAVCSLSSAGVVVPV